MSKILFQADNDLDQRIVVATKRLQPLIDFQTARTLNLHGVPDETVLQLAADEKRILVTHDRSTMPIHFENFVAVQNSFGVIIVSDQITIGAAANWLHLIWEVCAAEEFINVLSYVP